MLRIFIQDSLFSSQGELSGSCVGGPSAFNSPIWTQESFTQHLSTRQLPLWFIDIALKLGAQLSISITIFPSLWYDLAVTHNLRMRDRKQS